MFHIKIPKPSLRIDDIVWHVIIFQPQLRHVKLPWSWWPHCHVAKHHSYGRPCSTVFRFHGGSSSGKPRCWSWVPNDGKPQMTTIFLRDKACSISKRICFKILDLTWWPLPHQFPISKHRRFYSHRIHMLSSKFKSMMVQNVQTNHSTIQKDSQHPIMAKIINHIRLFLQKCWIHQAKTIEKHVNIHNMFDLAWFFKSDCWHQTRLC